MSTLLAPDLRKVPILSTSTPVVSIVLPFDPKMSSRTEIQQSLSTVLSHVKVQLRTNFPKEQCVEIMQRLNKMVEQLDYHTHKKSIAIFVAEEFEKIYYLDLPFNEKVVVGEQFDLKDLVNTKTENHQYLVLVLSGEWTRIYLGNSFELIRIVSNVPNHMTAYRNDIAERVGNFSDPSYQKEVMLKKFLHHTDEGLNILLEAYPLPLFVMGTERVMGYFSKITRNRKSIVGYVPGSFINTTDAAIREAIIPHVVDWKNVKQRDLINQLDAARGSGKLATGIQDVWTAADRKMGKLLIVENNYFRSNEVKRSRSIFRTYSPEDAPFYIHDEVDSIIEKVLQSGGDVEFVEYGMLEHFDRIALVQYY